MELDLLYIRGISLNYTIFCKKLVSSNLTYIIVQIFMYGFQVPVFLCEMVISVIS